MEQDVFDCALIKLRTDLQGFFRRRVADRSVAEDLAQDTVVKAYRARSTLRDPCRLRGWVYGIAQRTLADHYRGMSSIDECCCGVVSSDERLDDLSKVRAALTCAARCYLETLPRTYRDPVQLADYEGLPHAEVARRIGVSLTAVKSRVRRGKIIVRRLMEAQCRFQYDCFGNIIGYQVRPEALAAGCAR